MPKKPSLLLPQNMIKLSLGIFFVLIGIFGIMPDTEESIFSLNNRNLPLEVIFGVIELLCGAFIIISMFTFLTRKVKYTVSVVILVVWLLRIITSKFFYDLHIDNQWLIEVSCELIIAACLWLNMKTYQD